MMILEQGFSTKSGMPDNFLTLVQFPSLAFLNGHMFMKSAGSY